MQSKTDQIKNAILKNDYTKAISIASKFFDKSSDTKLYKQAQSALQSPAFYKQIGKNPEDILNKAIESLKIKFT
jgi:hypothetical protein